MHREEDLAMPEVQDLIKTDRKLIIIILKITNIFL